MGGGLTREPTQARSCCLSTLTGPVQFIPCFGSYALDTLPNKVRTPDMGFCLLVSDSSQGDSLVWIGWVVATESWSIFSLGSGGFPGGWIVGKLGIWSAGGSMGSIHVFVGRCLDEVLKKAGWVPTAPVSGSMWAWPSRTSRRSSAVTSHQAIVAVLGAAILTLTAD